MWYSNDKLYAFVHQNQSLEKCLSNSERKKGGVSGGLLETTSLYTPGLSGFLRRN